MGRIAASNDPWSFRTIKLLLRQIIVAGGIGVATTAAVVAPTAAKASTVSPYGEVARFGGLDEGATYSSGATGQTSGLVETIGQPAKLVNPVGMAVDREDPNATDNYSIYVLENVNPQALNPRALESMSLEYRIQKLSDSGILLASRKFTLTSTSTERDLHAVALAVDGPADRVYVLFSDIPSAPDNSERLPAIVAIDAWTTGRNGDSLLPAVGLTTGIGDDLKADPNTGAGELAGPHASNTLQGAGPDALQEDIDGVSISVYGSGPEADLAVAGNKYTSESTSEPAVEALKTSGAGVAGEVDGLPWSEAAETEDAAAKVVGQKSEALYSMSSNPNGSLNVEFGPITGEGPPPGTDGEPNMATIGDGAPKPSSVGPTSAILPGAIVAENLAQPLSATEPRYNFDAAATMGFSQDLHQGGLLPPGATPGAGTLAPTAVGLAEGLNFPDGLFAGVVAVREGEEEKDGQDPFHSSVYTWKEAKAEENSGRYSITRPASLGIRVFDAASESLAMIGNATPGGPCNIQSSPTLADLHRFVTGRPSFVALATGREGVVFALVQPNLLNPEESSSERIDPSSGLGVAEGDQIVEFAPGDDNAGAGENASKWRECPQPSGNFSVTNVTQSGATSVGGGEIAIPEKTTLGFDAEEVQDTKGEYESGINLRGGSPWAYDWTLEGGVDGKGNGANYAFPWTLRNTFTAMPEKGHAWTWATPTAEATFNKPGVFTETLNLVNDFGTLQTHRVVRVVKVGAIENAKMSISAATQGEPVRFTASLTLPEGDEIENYHWDFGDGQGEDTRKAPETEHVYAEAKTYTVKLTATDALGRVAEVSEDVNVGPKPESKGPGGGIVISPPAQGKETLPPLQVVSPSQGKAEGPKIAVQKPTNMTLAKALKTCRKIKAKRRRTSCEKQAQKKYGPKPKKKAKKKK